MKTILSLILALFVAMPAMAQDPKVTLDVYASTSAVQAGTSVDIAIRQNIIDNWHTYWVNAGDSGEPMSVAWDMPKGVEFSTIQEPTPNRIEYAPLVNFGHYGQPIFIQTVRVPDNFKGDTLKLNGEAFWLVCDDICIPESQKISLSIPVNDNGIAINQSVFETARANMPVVVGWDAQLNVQNGEVQLSVSVPDTLQNQMTDVEIYPFDWGIIRTTSDIMTDINDTGVTFIAQADDRDIVDLIATQFVIKTGNAAYQVNAKISGAPIQTQTYSLLPILLFAFIGGLILNLMPCVFPVLSMKALSLVKL
jgi:DsbC/DsbD-like thiol-disulfide interchange protein